MDDSPQNYQGVQPAAENTNTDQQYPDTPYPNPPQPKSRKKLIMIIGIVIVMLLLALGLALLLSNKYKKAAVCTDENCFDQHFAKCSPADYVLSQGGSSIKYVIVGAQSVGCTVSLEYLKAPYSPDAVGKSMTCNFDNRLKFQAAAQNVFQYPADYECKGDLVNMFQSLNSTANST